MEIAGDVFLVGQVSEGWGLLVLWYRSLLRLRLSGLKADHGGGHTPYLLFSLPGLPSKSYSHIGLGRDRQRCFEWRCEKPPFIPNSTGAAAQ